jgi:hypothetical protein
MLRFVAVLISTFYMFLFILQKFLRKITFDPLYSYTGRGGLDPELEAFRAAMEAKQKEDEDSPPGTQYYK